MALPPHAGHDLRSDSNLCPMNGGGPNSMLPRSRRESRRDERAYRPNRRAPRLETNAYHSRYCLSSNLAFPYPARRGPWRNRQWRHGLGRRLGKSLDGSLHVASHWLERDARVNGRHLRRPVRAPRSRHTPSCHSNSPSAEQSRAETKNTKCA